MHFPKLWPFSYFSEVGKLSDLFQRQVPSVAEPKECFSKMAKKIQNKEWAV